MTASGRFQPGADPRRGTGRPPSASGLAKAVRLTLGPDTAAIVGKIRTLALAGDPSGLLAAGFLLGAVATLPSGNRELAAGQPSKVAGEAA